MIEIKFFHNAVNKPKTKHAYKASFRNI